MEFDVRLELLLLNAVEIEDYLIILCRSQLGRPQGKVPLHELNRVGTTLLLQSFYFVLFKLFFSTRVIFQLFLYLLKIFQGLWSGF